jgi:hypothetical protein
MSKTTKREPYRRDAKEAAGIRRVRTRENRHITNTALRQGQYDDPEVSRGPRKTTQHPRW